MKTQKDIEIFEQFERLRFEVMDQDHFNLFKEKIKPYLGSLPEDEAINKYIQFNKHNRLFLNKTHILLYFSGDYNGSKTIILMDGYEIVHKDKTFTIEGDTYKYDFPLSAFWGIYHDMSKACGYSKRAIKVLRGQIRKERAAQTKQLDKQFRQAAWTQSPNIIFVDYTEKAFVIAGQTKPLKEKLKQLHGRFNPYLKDENGERFPGWVFSKKRKEKVMQELNI